MSTCTPCQYVHMQMQSVDWLIRRPKTRCLWTTKFDSLFSHTADRFYLKPLTVNTIPDREERVGWGRPAGTTGMDPTPLGRYPFPFKLLGCLVLYVCCCWCNRLFCNISMALEKRSGIVLHNLLLIFNLKTLCPPLLLNMCAYYRR